MKKKYYFDVSLDGVFKEKCKIKNDIYIGSISCVACENCIEHAKDIEFQKKYIVCSEIERATDKVEKGNITVEKLGELFRNNSNCYADTWIFNEYTGKHREGEVIQAMTEDKFIEVVKKLCV